jgi:hypothetical protein
MTLPAKSSSDADEIVHDISAPAEARAEIVTTTEACSLPVASAVLIGSEMTSARSDQGTNPMFPTYLASTPTVGASVRDHSPHPEAAPPLHEGQVLHVEMDSELHNTSTSEPSFLDDAPHQQRPRRRLIKWTIIGVGLFVLFVVVISVATDFGDESALPFAWSARDNGLPPSNETIAPVGIRGDISDIRDCQEHCDNVAGKAYMAAAFFFDKNPEESDPYETACVCYRNVPCIVESQDGKDGLVKSMVTLPNNKCSSEYGNNTTAL